MLLFDTVWVHCLYSYSCKKMRTGTIPSLWLPKFVAISFFESMSHKQSFPFILLQKFRGTYSGFHIWLFTQLRTCLFGHSSTLYSMPKNVIHNQSYIDLSEHPASIWIFIFLFNTTHLLLLCMADLSLKLSQNNHVRRDFFIYFQDKIIIINIIWQDQIRWT